MSWFGSGKEQRQLNDMAIKLELLIQTTNTIQTEFIKHMDSEEKLYQKTNENIDRLSDAIDAYRHEYDIEAQKLSAHIDNKVDSCNREMRQMLKDEYIDTDKAEILRREALQEGAKQREEDLKKLKAELLEIINNKIRTF